jgi:hypothetical protein
LLSRRWRRLTLAVMETGTALQMKASYDRMASGDKAARSEVNQWSADQVALWGELARGAGFEQRRMDEI